MRSKIISTAAAALFTVLLMFAVSAAGQADGVLNGETVGGLKLGDSAKKVTRAHGRPPEIKGGDDEPDPATGCVSEYYIYMDKGLEVEICNNVDTGDKTVTMVHLFEDSTLKTKKGVTIGASLSKLKSTYPKGLVQKSNNIYGIEDKDCWCGMYFIVIGGKVSEIALTGLGE